MRDVLLMGLCYFRGVPMEPKCTCDIRDPLKKCERCDKKARSIILEMSDKRDYEPQIDMGDDLSSLVTKENTQDHR